MSLETMLRVHFLQNWYALSDPMAEETLYDSEAMRRFAGIELGDDRIPDETTILNFRHLPERRGLTEAIFADVNPHLADRGITLRSGTLVDATIIDAPSSTKNKAGARDPEMSSTKMGNDWYFGMKAHIGVDADSGVTHSLETSTASAPSVRPRSRGLARSGVSCARPQRATRCIPSTNGPTASSPWCGPGSSTRSASSSASSAM